jgi:anion-transporting  ArsA/GET3 family ATPase
LPEPLPDYETRRLLKDLQELDASVGAVFLNRVLIGDPPTCARCRLTIQWQAASVESMRRQLRGIEVLIAPEFDKAIAGVEGLKRFTNKLWRLQDTTHSSTTRKPRPSAEKPAVKKRAG